MSGLPPGYLAVQARTVNVLTSELPGRFALAGPGVSRPGHVHAGVDFSGQRREPVLAMAAGRVRGVWAQRGSRRDEVSPRGGVVRAGELGRLPRGPGLYLELVHPALATRDLLHTVYMHLETVEVSQHQDVVAGQTLGSMGASGVVSDAVHLHFEVYTGPLDARGDQRGCLNPLGFQRYLSTRKVGAIRTDRPGNGVWEVSHVVMAPCFPHSGLPRGRAGVDKPLPMVDGYFRQPDGTAVVGLGPADPLAWRAAPSIRSAEPAQRTSVALPTAIWSGQ